MTLFGAMGESNRQGKAIFTFSGRLSPLGVLVIKTPFRNIDDVIYAIESTGQTPPTTIVCTYEIIGAVVKMFGWTPTVGFMPLIPSDGEEKLSVAIVGKVRR